MIFPIRRFLAVPFLAMAANPPVNVAVNSREYWLFLFINSAAILCGLALWAGDKK